MADIRNTDDMIDVRDVIARIEELEADLALTDEDKTNTGLTAATEIYDALRPLLAFMEEMKGNGGDEQWRGDWYPVTAIRDSYFKDYAQELAEDCGMIHNGLAWPLTCIDWDQAARELRMDYTSVEFDGVTYWVR